MTPPRDRAAARWRLAAGLPHASSARARTCIAPGFLRVAPRASSADGVGALTAMVGPAPELAPRTFSRFARNRARRGRARRRQGWILPVLGTTTPGAEPVLQWPLAEARHDGARGGARAPMVADLFFLDSSNSGESLLRPSSSTTASPRSSPRFFSRACATRPTEDAPVYCVSRGEASLDLERIFARGMSSPPVASKPNRLIPGPSHPVPPCSLIQTLP
jgi:hypothetical protein